MTPNTLISRMWLALVGSALAITQLHALDTDRADVQKLIGEMVTEHSFDRDSLTTTLAGAQTQQSILDAISRPAERVRQWHEYRQIFITPERIKAGVQFWNEHQETLLRISQDTGVPPEILVGIIGVETYFGRITGRYKVLDALVTLGFDYPPRSKFFRRELKEFLLLAREEELSIDETLGSYAGAMGSPQFIPSSYRAYAKDGDGNERRDLFQSWPDIIASVA
ncbi:MAG: lytic murein transglycosylase, partial [Pseudomonadota bacterium]